MAKKSKGFPRREQFLAPPKKKAGRASKKAALDKEITRAGVKKTGVGGGKKTTQQDPEVSDTISDTICEVKEEPIVQDATVPADGDGDDFESDLKCEDDDGEEVLDGGEDFSDYEVADDDDDDDGSDFEQPAGKKVKREAEDGESEGDEEEEEVPAGLDEQTLARKAHDESKLAKLRKIMALTKNASRRKEVYKLYKMQKAKMKKRVARAKKLRQRAGLPAIPADQKPLPRTIERARVPDVTTVAAEDEEVREWEEVDEFAAHLKTSEDTGEEKEESGEKKVPKILLTTRDRPTGRTVGFCRGLASIFPNCSYFYRRGLDLKKVIPDAIAQDYTAMMVVNEDHREPNAVLLCHLPDGPTFHYKLSSVKLSKDIKKCGEATDHHPELIINNLTTRLGRRVGRSWQTLFPVAPQLHGRRVVTLHNQRDYIFVRHHRYQFKRRGKKAALHELGPRFCLKLRSIQRGTFDSKQGEYEWTRKKLAKGESRHKFFL